MSLAYAETSWTAAAACAGLDPDALFVRGAAQRDLRQLCARCPVRLTCLAEALDSEANFGVWGGMTERERRVLLRRYADVESWSSTLAESDDFVISEIREGRIPRLTEIRSA
ncbi:WhiB family transcriptional regulator [Arcanobacterium canis]|uniref:Transcriptional regulator WhiB n=1 Tax=Arcanobacterium canis TaxID=999183 RepID=A0ABY8FZ97_9ACTO|nr:WhiB family transcriptional regulator [Arcanobacterium canis]WFM83537.1 WhiB family transcriptional regulator [Arcanobacterium canis]